MLQRKIGICFVLLFLSSIAESQPLLNGISLHKELGRDQFWGALYTEQLTDDAEVLITSAVAKRMELKVLAPEGIMSGRFSRMWIEGAAINNPSALLVEQAENMLQFDGFFRGRFEANDHIVLAFAPGKGTDVFVNNTLLGNIADDAFFPMLLRAWIGRVPLSSVYRDNLLKLGDIDEDIRHRYRHLEPRLSRIEIVKGWIEPKVVEPSEPDAKVVAEKEKIRVTKPSVTVPVIAVVPEVKPAQPTPEKINRAQPDAEQVVVEGASPTSNVVAATRVAVDVEEEKQALTAQMLLARQFYISEVLNTIYARVNYPRRAQQLQQSGSVKFNLVIDSQGNIKALKFIESTTHVLLNKAAEEAVKDAAPFPQLPAVIASNELELFVPIKFSIANPS